MSGVNGGSTPWVTVLTSVFNGAEFLDAAIESIHNQSYPQFEYLIIDDASTDATGEILSVWAARDPRIIIIKNRVNLGLTRSLNKGIVQARGVWIARQDADDISMPERLAKQVDFLARHPQIGLLGTASWWMDAAGLRESTPRLNPVSHTAICWRLLFENPFFHSSMMMARALVLANPYDETVRFGQDFELWGRLLTQTQGGNLDEPLICSRAHPQRVSALYSQQQQGLRESLLLERFVRVLPDFSGSMELLQRGRRMVVSAWPVAGESVETGRLLCRVFQAFAQRGQWDADQLVGVRRQLIERLWRSVGLVGVKGGGWHLVGEMWRVGGWEVVVVLLKMGWQRLRG